MRNVMSPRSCELDRAECDAVLARNHVGRMAFVSGGRADIAPVHYVYAGGRIFVRTSAGAKTRAIAHRPWVAFEVDEVDGLFEWRSVVVHATVFHSTALTGTAADRRLHREAIVAMRALDRQAFRDDDRAGFRTIVLALYPDQITGRASSVER